MKYYFDPALGIRAFESDGSQDFLITGAMRQLTADELEAHLNPTPTAEQLREQWKAERAAAVAAITVTTQAGNTFDGDEVSQGRMARAILALNASPAGTTVTWVLADNSTIEAAPAELTEALALAGAAQAALWIPA